MNEEIGMDAPQVFFDFCSMAFHQDAAILHDTLEGMVRGAYNFLDEVEQARLREFLRFLVNSNMTEKELSDLWDQSGADIYMGAQYREVFDHILKAVEEISP